MANVFKTRGSLTARARRLFDPDFASGSFATTYQELLWDAEALSRIITLVNSRSRRPRGEEDDTLDRIRDILHEESYTA